MISAHQQRQHAKLQRLSMAAALPKGSVLLVMGNPALSIYDHSQFRQNADFLYFCPLALGDYAVLLIGGEEPKDVLICPQITDKMRLWDGSGVNTEQAKQDFLFSEALEWSQPEWKNILLECHSLEYNYCTAANLKFMQNFMQDLQQTQQSKLAKMQCLNAYNRLALQRVRKSEFELDCIREAVKLTAKGHLVMHQARRGARFEYQIAAAALALWQQEGAVEAFHTIIGAGVNACVLHYRDNSAALEPHQGVLVDAGACTRNFYNGDITRVVPPLKPENPRFDALYKVVERAVEAATKAARVGAKFGDLHQATQETILQGLLEIGCIDSRISHEEQKKQLNQLFPHRTSHMLGVDVHDITPTLGNDLILEKNMVFTIEPGVYVSPRLFPNSPFAGIGIRLEQDVCVKDGQPEILSAGMPIELEEVRGI